MVFIIKSSFDWTKRIFIISCLSSYIHSITKCLTSPFTSNLGLSSTVHGNKDLNDSFRSHFNEVAHLCATVMRRRCRNPPVLVALSLFQPKIQAKTLGEQMVNRELNYQNVPLQIHSSG